MELTDEQIIEYCRLLHYKPATDGTLQEWLDDNAPGYTSKSLGEALLTENRVKKMDGYPPLSLVRRSYALHQR